MGNWITPLSADVNNNDVAWSVLVGGVAFTIVFAMIGNKILKSEVFMDMLAMTYIIVSVIGVVFFCYCFTLSPVRSGRRICNFHSKPYIYYIMKP